MVGRSLGSAVASMLAGARRVRAAILITPFDSLSEVAARHYPYLPVRLLRRHPFPSEYWARKAREPALVLAAASDDIIPPSHAQRLANAWGRRDAGSRAFSSGSQRYRIAPRLLSIDQRVSGCAETPERATRLGRRPGARTLLVAGRRPSAVLFLGAACAAGNKGEQLLLQTFKNVLSTGRVVRERP